MILKETLDKISKCNLPELRKNYDESKYHGEYEVRVNTLEAGITNLLKIVIENPLDQSQSKVLSLIFVVYKELLTAGPWNPPQASDFAKNLNAEFEKVNKTSIDKIIHKNSSYNTQEVFENCMEHLHSKLTADKFKKYPSFIKVYHSIISEIHEYDIKLKPLMTMPAALVLIDDYIEENKIAGLSCCKDILTYLKFEDFNNSNYYEVLYTILKKNVYEKNLDAIRLIFDCFEKIINILPNDNTSVSKNQKESELLSLAIDEMLMESNFNRKTVILKFLINIIEIHKSDCMRVKKKFMLVIIENLTLCTDNDFKILLLDTLELWIKYCWCVWRYKDDKILINTLLTILYTTEKENETIKRLQELISNLYKLCSPEEQMQFDSNMKLLYDEITVEECLARMKIIGEQ